MMIEKEAWWRDDLDLDWEVYICALVLLHANRSGRKFNKSVSEPLKK